MLGLKQKIFLGLLTSFIFANNVNAGLYGFSHTNPYTHEETILHIDTPPQEIKNYRQEMRDNIDMLASFAKKTKPDFQIIAHEGQELLNKSLWEFHLDGYTQARKMGVNANDPTFLSKLNLSNPNNPELFSKGSLQYRENINAIAKNNIFCGEDEFKKPNDIKIIDIESCKNQISLEQSMQDAIGDDMIFYGKLDNPKFNKVSMPIINENAQNVYTINEAKNINLLFDSSKYNTKNDFIKDIRNTNFDAIVINPIFNNQEPFSKEEINSLKYKKNGTKRLVIAEMNIAEATPNLYYWKKDWQIDNPSWLKRLSFVNDNNIIVEYWNDEWKNIISKHFNNIIKTDYDGIFLTGIHNYQYFEQQTPLE